MVQNKVTLENEKSTLHIDYNLYLSDKGSFAHICITKDTIDDTVTIEGIVLNSDQVEMLVKFLIS